AATPAGPVVPIRLHALPRAGSHHRRRGVSAPDLPLRAELLELGNRHDLLLGKLRKSEPGLAAGVMGTGRGAARTSIRPDECGGEQSDGPEGVHPELRITAGALQSRGPENPGGTGQ